MIDINKYHKDISPIFPTWEKWQILVSDSIKNLNISKTEQVTDQVDDQVKRGKQ